MVSLGKAECSSRLIVPLIDTGGEAGVADGCVVLPHKPDGNSDCEDDAGAKYDNENKTKNYDSGAKYDNYDNKTKMLHGMARCK